VARQSESSVYLDGPWSHRSVSANGTRFHIAENGDGPLVLLLHGFPEFWWTWRRQLSTLASAGFRAVALDLRGFGGSDKPPRGYDLITAASDAAGLIRSLGEAYKRKRKRKLMERKEKKGNHNKTGKIIKRKEEKILKE